MKLYTAVVTGKPTKRGAHTIVETICYEVHADLRSLNAFGLTAARNKNGKAKKGPFICQVITRSENVQ